MVELGFLDFGLKREDLGLKAEMDILGIMELAMVERTVAERLERSSPGITEEQMELGFLFLPVWLLLPLAARAKTNTSLVANQTIVRLW